MLVRRNPILPLRPFVSTLWAQWPSTAEPGASAAPKPSSLGAGPEELPAGAFERVLPTGAMHLVFRLSPEPLRVADGGPPIHLVGAILGGARARAYVKDVSVPVATVGVQLRPGGSGLVCGAPASDLADAHTPLDALWGLEAARLVQRLGGERCPERQLDLVEAALLARLPRARSVHPAVAAALPRIASDDSIRAIVAGSGYSHRHFATLFSEAIGLTPKRYARVVRFGRALAALPSAPSLSRLALDVGYADQAHFNREFREMSGIAPSMYLRAAPEHRHHVPTPAARPRPRPRLTGQRPSPAGESA